MGKMKVKNKTKLVAVFLTVMLFLSLLAPTAAFALSAYTNASSNSSSTVYCLPNTSSMVIGSIGIETVKVYWQESGYYYIEYVVSGGGYSGYKRGYVPTSKINVSGIGDISYASWNSNTYSNQTVYNRPITSSLVIGTVFNSDTTTILQEDGSWYYVQYPITGGYKRGYIPKSSMPGYALSLNVKGYKQEQDQWCWAATARTVLNYLGTSPTQTQIVTSVKGSAVNQPATFTEDRASLTNFGVTTTSIQNTISFSTLKDNILGWYSPVKTAVFWSGGGGHSRVLYGYYENGGVQNVFYEDPGVGSTTWNVCTYSWYVSNPNWTWGWTHYFSSRG